MIGWAVSIFAVCVVVTLGFGMYEAWDRWRYH